MDLKFILDIFHLIDISREMKEWNRSEIVLGKETLRMFSHVVRIDLNISEYISIFSYLYIYI